MGGGRKIVGVTARVGIGFRRVSLSLDKPMCAVIASGENQRVEIEEADVGEPSEEPKLSGDKPPYRIPTMEEVRALPWNGLTVASTFSGAGGSSLGYKMAGFRVLWASEFVEAARETYAANFPDTVIDGRDIREVKPEEILAATGLREGELDVLDGSPPCASFSTAGKREKKWGKESAYSDTRQRTDDLFFEYARILKGLRPRAFVAENVAGLVKGVAKGYFLQIHEALEKAGYRVRARLLDAQWLGVPQARQRVIFVGVREDLGLEPAHPDPLPYRYSIREAISGISAGIVNVVHDTSGEFSTGEVFDRPSPAITVGVNSVNSYHFKVHESEGYALPKRQMSNAPYGMSGWQDARSNPSQTIGASPNSGNGRSPPSIVEDDAGKVRKLTITELKRLCSFPDDFVLTGTYQQQWERCGRAVPPLMMRAVAEALRDRVFGELR